MKKTHWTSLNNSNITANPPPTPLVLSSQLVDSPQDAMSSMQGFQLVGQEIWEELVASMFGRRGANNRADVLVFFVLLCNCSYASSVVFVWFSEFLLFCSCTLIVWWTYGWCSCFVGGVIWFSWVIWVWFWISFVGDQWTKDGQNPDIQRDLFEQHEITGSCSS